MRTVPLSISSPSSSPTPSPTVNSINNLSKPPLNFCRKLSFLSRVPLHVPPPLCDSVTKSGVCRASQAVELFPTLCPEIVVREARLEDSWEVAETHCSCFFPEYAFPLDFMLRIDRLIASVSGFSVPNGCKRTCLVAVINGSMNNDLYLGSFGGFDGKFGLSRGYVAGILTVDTVADFLPRKGPLRQRRTGIAYISNVAVREKDRRKGIAKRLVAKAEVHARSWGCRAIALHCDMKNPGATQLYKGQGFRCIKVPERANWPHPKASPNVQFSFMMKLLASPTTS